MSKLSKNDFRRIEYLLYNSKELDAEIRELQTELENAINCLDDIYPISAVNFDGMPHGSGTSSPTENLAIKRADNLQIKRLKKRIEELKRQQSAINKAKELLNDKESLLIKLKYDKEKPPRECWKEMRISKAHFYGMRNEVIHKIVEKTQDIV